MIGSRMLLTTSIGRRSIVCVTDYALEPGVGHHQRQSFGGECGVERQMHRSALRDAKDTTDRAACA